MKLVTASPMNVQHRKQGINKQNDLNGSFTDILHSPVPLEPPSDGLHSSYGSLSNSYGNLNASVSSLANYHDADQFETEELAFFSPQKSPWNVQLRKTDQRFPNSVKTASPSPRLRKVSEQKRGDWNEPSASSLLQDFNPSSPQESPWRKRFTKPSLPSNRPTLDLPVYESPVKAKQKKPSKTIAETPIKVKSSKSITTPATEDATNQGLTKTPKKKTKKTISSQSTAKKAKKKCKAFVPSQYGRDHEQAATLIAALARGRNGRLKAKVLRLERRLKMVELSKVADIAEIKEKTKQDKKEWKKRARDRFTKNLNRKGHQDAQLQENQEIIDRIRQENSKVRDQNKQMAKDIEALRVNNERLTVNQAATEACFSQLQYHDETCEGENARLRAINAKYEKAVEDHQEHLDLHNSHIDAETKIKSHYKKLLENILSRLEESKGYNVLTSEVREMAEELDEFNHLD